MDITCIRGSAREGSKRSGPVGNLPKENKESVAPMQLLLHIWIEGSYSRVIKYCLKYNMHRYFITRIQQFRAEFFKDKTIR